ncbi:unnamed protein product [Ilex paraguariensis]|uniref:Glycosyltransferase n=1 Tax=Ilex paraguariensis TaxID=185542 RepID=A0ABC8UNF3_9AQUA
MAGTHQKLHAIMIAYPLQGHINPFVNLAMKLASKGFTITFVHTQHIHHQITQSQSQTHTTTEQHDIFAGARNSGLDIRYTTITDGLPLEFDRSSNFVQYWECILEDFQTHVDEYVGRMVKSDPSSAYFLIADTFFAWPATVAEKYNLVNVSFWTEPALVFTLNYHLDLLIENGHFASHDNRKDTIDYIPGVQAIEPKDLMSTLQKTDISTLVHRVIFKAFEQVKKADIVTCNTVQELESETISALQQKLPTYAIGPIFPLGFTKSIVDTNLWSESECTRWLDTKPHGSVLYVSFGSLANISEHDFMEIAHGLLLSGVTFVWVVRPGIVNLEGDNNLPDRFKDVIGDQGLIVPWCCQIEVISHSAIGGFLTHCGWNSILESMWCGVPLICFPVVYDQITNRKLVVDDWRIGINLCDKKSITREEVVEKINSLMRGNTSSNELRKEMKKVKKTLENALDIDGSSEKNFEQFIKKVKELIGKRNGLEI